GCLAKPASVNGVSALIPITWPLKESNLAWSSRNWHISLVHVLVNAAGKNASTVVLPRRSLIFTALRSTPMRVASGASCPTLTAMLSLLTTGQIGHSVSSRLSAAAGRFLSLQEDPSAYKRKGLNCGTLGTFHFIPNHQEEDHGRFASGGCYVGRRSHERVRRGHGQLQPRVRPAAG